MKISKGGLSTGLVLTAVGWALSAVSAAGVPENAAVVSKTVFEGSLNGEEVAAYFDVDRELGRAWIDVVITSEGAMQADEPGAPEVVREALDGLYYDPVQKQVIYRMGSKRIVCAEDSSFLWATSLKDTGRCELRSSTEARRIDDGFKVEVKNVGKIVFEARNPA